MMCGQGCASSPNNEEQQKALRQAAEELRAATSAASANALKKQILSKLQVSIRASQQATLTHQHNEVQASVDIRC